MNYLEERYVNRLLLSCTLRKDHKSCKTLDLYLAVARLVARLENELEEFKFKPPLGPDPAPELSEDLKFLLDGDPDGNPSRIFPTADFSSDRERFRSGLESAGRLREALTKVVSALDENINELEREVGKETT